MGRGSFLCIDRRHLLAQVPSGGIDRVGGRRLDVRLHAHAVVHLAVGTGDVLNFDPDARLA